MTIIEQLEDADKTLAADGYKEYSYVRIAISEAIRALRQPPVSGEVCVCKNRQDQFKRGDTWICGDCEEEIKQTVL